MEQVRANHDAGATAPCLAVHCYGTPGRSCQEAGGINAKGGDKSQRRHLPENRILGQESSHVLVPGRCAVAGYSIPESTSVSRYK